MLWGLTASILTLSYSFETVIVAKTTTIDKLLTLARGGVEEEGREESSTGTSLRGQEADVWREEGIELLAASMLIMLACVGDITWAVITTYSTNTEKCFAYEYRQPPPHTHTHTTHTHTHTHTRGVCVGTQHTSQFDITMIAVTD